VNPRDGALQFTDAGNSTGPEREFAGQNVTGERSYRPVLRITMLTPEPVYQNGFFVYDGMPHYWLACLRTLPGGVPGTGRAFRIFAPTPGNLEKGNCEQIRLATTAVPRSQGAFKYD
jgi:hypothetical protein